MHRYENGCYETNGTGRFAPNGGSIYIAYPASSNGHTTPLLERTLAGAVDSTAACCSLSTLMCALLMTSSHSKANTGTGVAHNDYERGIVGVCVVCLEAPNTRIENCECGRREQKKRHLGRNAKTHFPNGRTLLNLSTHGQTPVYGQDEDQEKAAPIAVALEPGEFVFFRNYHPEKPNNLLPSCWHTGEMVACGCKKILSVSVYRIDRANNHDYNFPHNWREASRPATTAIQCGHPRNNVHVEARAASAGQAWTSDESTEMMHPRAFGAGDAGRKAYLNATGRRRAKLADFVKVFNQRGDAMVLGTEVMDKSHNHGRVSQSDVAIKSNPTPPLIYTANL